MQNLPADQGCILRLCQLAQRDDEFVSAGTRHRVFFSDTVGKASCDRLQQLVADAVAEGVVYGFKPVEIDEQQCARLATASGTHHCLLHPVVEQQAVREARQIVVQRDVAQLVVRGLQRFRMLRGAGGELRVERGYHQRDHQYAHRCDSDKNGKHVVTQAAAGRGGKANTVRCKLGRRHSRVVHAGNGEAHEQGAADFGQYGGAGPFVSQLISDPKGGHGRCYRDDYGCDEKRRVVNDRGRHPHRRHAGVMHDTNAGPHQCGADGKISTAHDGSPYNKQGDARHQHCYEPRQYIDRNIVGQRDGQMKCQHADEVHRPDAGAHGECAAKQPDPRACAPGLAHASGKIECRIGCDCRNHHGKNDQLRIVHTDHIGPHIGRKERVAVERLAPAHDAQGL